MALAPGTRRGPYEITGKIGAGGMGEVYRARDVKLNRDVALKVLPEAFASDPERLARFEREAKTLAALNHAHIAHSQGTVPQGSRAGSYAFLPSACCRARAIAWTSGMARPSVRAISNAAPPSARFTGAM